MALIALEGIHFYAYHGFYEEEQIIGNHFVVDVKLSVGITEAADEDDLYSTVNYETVFLICQSQMKKKTKLLESLAMAIAHRLQEYFEQVEDVWVRIRKKNPPLGGRIDSAYVEYSTFDQKLEEDDGLKLEIRETAILKAVIQLLK